MRTRQDPKCPECESHAVHIRKRKGVEGQFSALCNECAFIWTILTDLSVAIPPKIMFKKYEHRIRFIGPQPPLTPGIPTGH